MTITTMTMTNPTTTITMTIAVFPWFVCLFTVLVCCLLMVCCFLVCGWFVDGVLFGHGLLCCLPFSVLCPLVAVYSFSTCKAWPCTEMPKNNTWETQPPAIVKKHGTAATWKSNRFEQALGHPARNRNKKNKNKHTRKNKQTTNKRASKRKTNNKTGKTANEQRSTAISTMIKNSGNNDNNANNNNV